MTIIAIESIDNVGKDTLIEQIRIQHPHFLFLDFPDESSASGKLTRKILNEEVYLPPNVLQHLFIANFFESYSLLSHAKNNKSPVLILNRYFLSTLAYGCASNVNIDCLNKLIKHLPQPDMFVLLKGERRIEGKELDKFEKNNEFQEKVEENLYGFAPDYNYTIIENNGTPEDMYEQFKDKCGKLLRS